LRTDGAEKSSFAATVPVLKGYKQEVPKVPIADSSPRRLSLINNLILSATAIGSLLLVGNNSFAECSLKQAASVATARRADFIPRRRHDVLCHDYARHKVMLFIDSFGSDRYGYSIVREISPERWTSIGDIGLLPNLPAVMSRVR
jgi:hypothetical protein